MNKLKPLLHTTLMKNIDRLFVLSSYFFILSSVCFWSVGCKSYKNIAYLQDVPDSLTSEALKVTTIPYIDPKIGPDDILEVRIQTPLSNNIMGSNEETPITSIIADNGRKLKESEFLVDKDGFIFIPQIGKIKVGGLSTFDAARLIEREAAFYYKNPVVNVRNVNFKITVLGEVAKPGQYIIPNEKLTVFEALGIAGDLTIYGKRNNVMLVRNVNTTTTVIRLDLNKSDIFASPYYYIRPGDIIYVQPNKAKVASSDASQVRTLSILTSLTTLAIVLITRVNF